MSMHYRRQDSPRADWVFALSLVELRRKGAVLKRVNGKQIALFETSQGVRACDNRCPHEGYPLSEGSLSEDCTLTCNWHNWKFNLDTGENLYGGDTLRTYAVDVRGDEVWVDIADPPYEQRYDSVKQGLHDAFDDHDYDRIAREIARLSHIGGDPLDALRLSIHWSWQRLEFGWTHAYAGMADWLALYDEFSSDKELQLVCLQESVAHAAFDVLREREYPFTEEIRKFDEAEFLAAVEAEDETVAAGGIRGGIRDGLQFCDFERALTQAALAHYNDFGHSLIYVTKAGALINRLGRDIAEPLLLSLVRGLIYATREDKIPEFRAYSTALAAWGHGGTAMPDASAWRRCGITKSLETAVTYSAAPPLGIYRGLLVANAINMLSYDQAQQDKIRVTVSDNIGWLDFTHGLTFANAVRKQCSRFPTLWPQGLLQMACFNGRNSGYTLPEADIDKWRLTDLHRDIDTLLKRVFDHGLGEYIVSVHWLKTIVAVREEIRELPLAQGEWLGAALNRFINSPLKRRHARRTAHQSLQFIAKE